MVPLMVTAFQMAKVFVLMTVMLMVIVRVIGIVRVKLRPRRFWELVEDCSQSDSTVGSGCGRECHG